MSVAPCFPTGVSALAAAIARGWATVAEIGTPRTVATGRMRRAIELVGPQVDAVGFPDNPGATVHMAPIAGCCLALAAGVEPAMAVSCRDRTLGAIQSDAMAAHALGVRNLFVVTGDRVRRRAGRQCAPVGQVESPDALQALDRLRRVGGPDAPRRRPVPLLLCGTADPNQPPERHFRHLASKARAGADCLVTQMVTDPESLAAWMRAYHDALGDWARPVLAGIGIIRSPRTVDFLNRRAAGIRVPEAWRDELATSSDPEALAVARAAELVAAVREVPGVCGVHLTALGWYAGLPRLLDALAQTRLAPAEA